MSKLFLDHSKVFGVSVKRSKGGQVFFFWAQVRILKETDKAILVESGIKTWIPKSRIHNIRLKNNVFEIYVEESVIG